MPAIESLPPIHNGFFEYGSSGFTSHGVQVVEGPRLRELLSPENAKGKRAQKRAEEDARKLIKKPWMIAQLRLYDIPNKSSASVADLKQLLISSVKQGKCNSVPPRIVNLKAALESEYNAKNAAYLTDRQSVKNEQFSSLSNPTEEANYDIDMFLAKYFLNDDKSPSRTKTPIPIPLPGFQNRASMHAAAEKVQGLETVSGGHGKDRAIVIGWQDSQPSVWNVAGQIDTASYEAQKKIREGKWNETLQAHHTFVNQLPKASGHSKFDASAEGKYAIDFKAIAEQWPEDSENMTLRIARGQAQEHVGAFDFGILEGMMRFDTDQQRLLARCIEDEDEERCETSDREMSEDCISNPPSKRKKGSISKGTRPAKRNKASSKADQRRLHLQWRGRETGEGEIQLGDVKSNAGYLDFIDNACTRFEGRISFDLVGKNLAFTGYKISSSGASVTDSWSNYSESAYENARTARWH
ncbi:MAG: hypothetical protein Q9166_004693 [cf. Caloplaca sp. 2 TL-2023]